MKAMPKVGMEFPTLNAGTIKKSVASGYTSGRHYAVPRAIVEATGLARLWTDKRA